MRTTSLLGVQLLLLVVIHSGCSARLRPRVKVVQGPYQQQGVSPSRRPPVAAATATDAPRRRTSSSPRRPPRPVPATRRNHQQQQQQAPKSDNLHEKVYKVSVPPQPRPGYYYNLHVKKPGLITIKGFNSETNEEKQGPYFGGIRSAPAIGRDISRQVAKEGETGDDRVFFENNRFWRVAPKPKLKPGFYLNQQFQNKIAPTSDRKVSAPSKNIYEKVTFRVDSQAETKYHEVTPSLVPADPVVDPVGSRVVSSAVSADPQEPVNTGPAHSPSVFYDSQRINPSSSAPSAFAPIPVVFASNQRNSARPPSQEAAQPSAFIPTHSSRPDSREPTRASRPTPRSRPKSKTQPTPRPTPATSAAASPVAVNAAFSCEGRESGYYPNEASGCKKYHVCNPVNFRSGKVISYKHDFTCSPGTTWDQHKLVCVADHLAASCSQSVALAFGSSVAS